MFSSSVLFHIRSLKTFGKCVTWNHSFTKSDFAVKPYCLELCVTERCYCSKACLVAGLSANMNQKADGWKCHAVRLPATPPRRAIWAHESKSFHLFQVGEVWNSNIFSKEGSSLLWLLSFDRKELLQVLEWQETIWEWREKLKKWQRPYHMGLSCPSIPSNCWDVSRQGGLQFSAGSPERLLPAEGRKCLLHHRWT